VRFGYYFKISFLLVNVFTLIKNTQFRDKEFTRNVIIVGVENLFLTLWPRRWIFTV
jgi:hypothetical protein